MANVDQDERPEQERAQWVGAGMCPREFEQKCAREVLVGTCSQVQNEHVRAETCQVNPSNDAQRL